MPLTLSVYSSLEAAQEVSKQLPENTLDKAKALYRVLVAVGIEYAKAKGFSPAVTVITFHSSIELLSEACGFSRVTAWKYLKQLQELGVCDYRTKKTACRGLTRNSGTVFMVRLGGNFEARCKLSFHDLKHKWVDMDKAVRLKTTSYNALNIQKNLESLLLKFQILLQYSLSPKNSINPDKSCMLSSRQPSLESLLAVPHAQGTQVAEAVNTAAVSLAAALQDSKSIDFYRKLLWRLKSRLNACGANEFHTVYTQVLRIVKGDIPEWSGLRSPGSLLIHRLKGYKWWQEIMAV